MTLPSGLAAALEMLLGAPPRQVQLVSGGDISQAARVEAAGGTFLVKWHAHPPRPAAGWPGMFEAEARGLQLLTSAKTVRVPAVLGFGEPAGNSPAFIAMEWIERGTDSQRAAAALGKGLAALHHRTTSVYGLDHHNYCGATPQDNTQCESWVEFYGERRLGFQLALAARRGLMPTARRGRLERVIAGLDRWIDESACQPSLLHGDLWGGNWLAGADGEPALIDPAVYFGDREAELAMCRLFGGFPPDFYRAYDHAWPPAPGRDGRIQLYQLYHVLNHLNLFGESYGGQVDAILRRYAG